MTIRTDEGRSLVGASRQTVRTWVASYIQQSGSACSVDQLISAALLVEGTHKGVTKTKVRKARRALLGNTHQG